jgi:polygalacturonase
MDTMIDILLVTARCLTLEIRNGQAYRSRIAHVFWLNGVPWRRSWDNVVRLTGLVPGQHYRVDVFSGGERQVLNFSTPAETWRLDVRAFGAVGDGAHDDTSAMQAAIMACPAGGTVVLPAGNWLSGPLFLKSDMHLHLMRDACLLGHPDIARWPLLPAVLQSESGTQVLGSWEGQPASCHASLINALGVQNVLIDGEGSVDGNASFQTWWSRPKTPFLGWRPRTILLANCSDIHVSGIRLRNSPSWTLHALRSKLLVFSCLDIQAPVDSPNTDGINPESCEQVRIAGVRISTGDDCIAIKSGKPGPHGTPPPSRAIRISNCLLERGHGAVVIGSETAGGVYDVLAEDCVFDGTDRGLRIKTRRGRGRAAVIDGIELRNVRMRRVGTAFVVNSFYFCDPDGRAPHVGDRRALPVDDGTPTVRNLRLVNVDCDEVAHAGIYVLGLPEHPVQDISVRNLRIRFDALAEPGCPDMAEGIEPMQAIGIHLLNVRGFRIQGLDMQGQQGEAMTLENVA